MHRRTAFLVLWLGFASSARGQVLVTGETGGSGAQAVVATANVLKVRDFSTLANYWVEYAYGATDRVDLFASYGNISVFDETQHYVAFGSNIAILKRDRSGIDVSFFNNASLPFTKRDRAADVLLTLAVVASRPVKAGAIVVTPYGGFNALVPVGHRERGVFTPVDNLKTAIVGAAIGLTKTWTLFAEYDPGPHLQAGGVAVAVTLPKLR